MVRGLKTNHSLQNQNNHPKHPSINIAAVLKLKLSAAPYTPSIRQPNVTNRIRLAFFFKVRYGYNMYINISFNPSAFKHGKTEDDIKWAINTQICDVLMDGYDNKYAIIGFDKTET